MDLLPVKCQVETLFFKKNRQTFAQVLLLNLYQKLEQGNFMVYVTEEARADNNPF